MSETGHWIASIGNYSVNVDTLITMWTAMAFLLVFAFIATRKLSLVPSRLQAFVKALWAFSGVRLIR